MSTLSPHKVRATRLQICFAAACCFLPHPSIAALPDATSGHIRIPAVFDQPSAPFCGPHNYLTPKVIESIDTLLKDVDRRVKSEPILDDKIPASAESFMKGLRVHYRPGTDAGKTWLSDFTQLRQTIMVFSNYFDVVKSKIGPDRAQILEETAGVNLALMSAWTTRVYMLNHLRTGRPCEIARPK
jgi:hypothetical protein